MRPTDWIVLHHAQGTVHAGPAEGAVVSCHGHGEEADGNGAGFSWKERLLAAGQGRGGRESGGERGTFFGHCLLRCWGWGIMIGGGGRVVEHGTLERLIRAKPCA